MSVGIKFYYQVTNPNEAKIIYLSTGKYKKDNLKDKNILKNNGDSDYNPNTYMYKIYRGYQIIFYKDGDTNGNSKTITVNHYKNNDEYGSLSSLGSGYQNFKSIEIKRLDGPVIIYNNSNKGNPKHITGGTYNKSDLVDIGLINNNQNNFYSCDVIPGYRLIVYDDKNLAGNSQTISNEASTGNKYIIFNSNLRYNIKSIKIEKIPESFTTENFTQNSNNNMIYYILFALFIYYIMTRKK